MKSSLFSGCLISAFAALHLGSAAAQDLPTGLLLPPRPAEMARKPDKVRLPGLPGGPAQVFVPISHLTLPEKPEATPLDGQSEAEPPPEETPELVPDPLPGELPQNTDHPLLGPTDPPPSIDLLPPSGDPPGGLPDDLPSPDSPPADGAPPAGSAGVPGSDLSPTPKQATGPADPKERGPIFRIKGADAYLLARQRGYRFTPAQGIGRRDGVHTVASQVPNVLTSEVHGTRMMQMRPSPLWTTPYIENTFYMFCDGSYNAVRLTPGWKVRGIQIKGPDWQWVACPRSGAGTASFSIRIRAWKVPDAPAQGTVVTFQGLTLEGPAGATDWKAAFPDLNRPGVPGPPR